LLLSKFIRQSVRFSNRIGPEKSSNRTGRNFFAISRSSGENFDPRFLFRPNLKDEADNMFVELAVVSNSHYLATSNLRDYRNSNLIFKRYSKTEILHGFDEVMGKVKVRDVPDWDKL
jgi:predicted nucleic acid-binding protein